MPQGRENCWPRLEKVIKWSEMTTNHFAQHIGLARGENLYQIKRGNNGISRKLAEMVVEKFPEVNMIWLLTGQGDIFNIEDKLSSQIKYYDLDVERAIDDVESGSVEPTATMLLPVDIEAEFAMSYRSAAMGDIVPANAIVALREVDSSMAVAGGEYLVKTEGFTLLRTLRNLTKESTSLDTMRLTAARGELDDIIVERKDILAIYKVVAKVSVNY